jgi:hypothetical protein
MRKTYGTEHVGLMAKDISQKEESGISGVLRTIEMPWVSESLLWQTAR